jgi:hypothetical protein
MVGGWWIVLMLDKNRRNFKVSGTDRQIGLTRQVADVDRKVELPFKG